MEIAIRTALLLAAAVFFAGCQPDAGSADDSYIVEGKPVPSVAASDPVYAAFPEFKAMAVNADGIAFLSIGQCSVAKAVEDALGDCRRGSGDQACRLSAIGNADASGLDESGVSQLIRQHSRAIARLRSGRARSSTAIPVVLAGSDVPYLPGVASGSLYYDPSIPCFGEVVAQTKEGLVCDGVWQFRRRLDSTEYPVEGDLDFECSNGARIAGTYITFASGLGAALVADDRGRTLFALYGPDVAGGVEEGQDFLRLWQERAARAPEASIFQKQPVVP
jgi:hypothetical protein